MLTKEEGSASLEALGFPGGVATPGRRRLKGGMSSAGLLPRVFQGGIDSSEPQGLFGPLEFMQRLVCELMGMAKIEPRDRQLRSLIAWPRYIQERRPFFKCCWSIRPSCASCLPVLLLSCSFF